MEQQDVRPFDPWRTVTPLECQSIAKAIAQRTVEEPCSEFFEIWRMQQATVVKWPSAWYIKYPLELQDRSGKVYDALFGDGLQDVDSAMAGTLAHVLGPATITLRDTVPLPPSAPLPSPPQSPDTGLGADMSGIMAPQTFADFGDNVHHFGLNDDDFDDDGRSEVADEWDSTLKKRRALTSLAKRDPRWDAVEADLPTAKEPWPSAECDCILSIIKVAQQKNRHHRSALEKYVLAEWSEQKHGTLHPGGHRSRLNHRSCSPDRCPLQSPDHRHSQSPSHCCSQSPHRHCS